MAATTDLAENKLEPEPIPGATVEVSTDAVDESEVQPLPSSDVPDVEASADVGDGDPSEREVSVVPDSKKWPGWPGHCVFRMIVPVVKVGSIIGRKGEFIKKMCEETKARIRILEGVVGTTDRIVLITGKEEPDAEFSPAMSGLLRVFRRINGIPDSEDDGSTTALQPLCSSRILVASTQAISLIGKGGVVIKSIQEGSGATVRVLPGEELPHYAVSDERIVDIQGEPLKVLKALELVVGQLRKFLVDQSIIPLFEKNLSSSITSAAQDRVVDKTPASVHGTTHTGISNDYPPPLMRDPLYYERESHLDSHLSRSGLALYGQDPALSNQRPSGLGRTPGALVTQITQTMQIPLSYAEDIIGIGGANIAYIRRTSGAILTVQESRGLSDEITVEIKGSSSEVHTAQQLIQDFIAGHKEPAGGSYGGLDSNYMSSYSQLGSAPYSSSSLPSQHGSSGRLGGYGGYRY